MGSPLPWSSGSTPGHGRRARSTAARRVSLGALQRDVLVDPVRDSGVAGRPLDGGAEPGIRREVVIGRRHDVLQGRRAVGRALDFRIHGREDVRALLVVRGRSLHRRRVRQDGQLVVLRLDFPEERFEGAGAGVQRQQTAVILRDRFFQPVHLSGAEDAVPRVGVLVGRDAVDGVDASVFRLDDDVAHDGEATGDAPGRGQGEQVQGRGLSRGRIVSAPSSKASSNCSCRTVACTSSGTTTVTGDPSMVRAWVRCGPA